MVLHMLNAIFPIDQACDGNTRNNDTRVELLSLELSHSYREWTRPAWVQLGSSNISFATSSSVMIANFACSRARAFPTTVCGTSPERAPRVPRPPEGALLREAGRERVRARGTAQHETRAVRGGNEGGLPSPILTPAKVSNTPCPSAAASPTSPPTPLSLASRGVPRARLLLPAHLCARGRPALRPPRTSGARRLARCLGAPLPSGQRPAGAPPSRRRRRDEPAPRLAVPARPLAARAPSPRAAPTAA